MWTLKPAKLLGLAEDDWLVAYELSKHVIDKISVVYRECMICF